MSPTPSLARLLDAADATPEATALRARTYDLLALPDGAAVVDVGCGAGRAVGELAARGARAIGVDLSAEMIALARSRGPERDLRIGDARALPLADGEVAGYRADKVLHELPDPAEALEEARRVLAPGGRIVLLRQDWDGFLIDSADPVLTRTIVHARADAVTNPWAARRFRNLLLDTGFADVTAEAHTSVLTGDVLLPMLTGLAAGARAAGAISPEQEAAWAAEQRERVRAGRAFLALPMFVAAARRP
ncbi:methyltransferase domain-containing protein [Nonomuraea aridisoli]|nr:methyltransferase domain-containing protein [Nonomuraea aridisoli]